MTDVCYELELYIYWPRYGYRNTKMEPLDTEKWQYAIGKSPRKQDTYPPFDGDDPRWEELDWDRDDLTDTQLFRRPRPEHAPIQTWYGGNLDKEPGAFYWPFPDDDVDTDKYRYAITTGQYRGTTPAPTSGTGWEFKSRYNKGETEYGLWYRERIAGENKQAWVKWREPSGQEVRAEFDAKIKAAFEGVADTLVPAVMFLAQHPEAPALQGIRDEMQIIGMLDQCVRYRADSFNPQDYIKAANRTLLLFVPPEPRADAAEVPQFEVDFTKMAVRLVLAERHLRALVNGIQEVASLHSKAKE